MLEGTSVEEVVVGIKQVRLSKDAVRLLYAIGRYSRNGEGTGAGWMRKDGLDVVAHLGVKSGVFSGYDLAPALYQYRGVKMFAMLCHEADEDVDVLFRANLIERILLNTWFYATLTGVRITDAGEKLLRDHATEADRAAVNGITECKRCGRLTDFAVSVEDVPKVHLVMCQVCTCRTKGRHRQGDDWCRSCKLMNMRIDGFFGIGDVEYVASPFFFPGANRGK